MRIHYEENGSTRLLLRVADPELVDWLAALQKVRFDFFQLFKGAEPRFVLIKSNPPADPVVIEPAPTVAPTPAFFSGQVASVQAITPGGETLTYWYGRPAPCRGFRASTSSSACNWA